MSEFPEFQLTLINEEEKSLEINLDDLNTNLSQRGAGGGSGSSPTHSEQERLRAAEYLELHRIPEVMNRLMVEMLLQTPENPIAFSIQFFHTKSMVMPSDSDQKVLSSRVDRTKEKVTGEDAKKYMLLHKIPWMMEDMLSGLLFEMPEDPLSFVLSWLRWNRAKYGGGGGGGTAAAAAAGAAPK